jgi:hypothetical protein
VLAKGLLFIKLIRSHAYYQFALHSRERLLERKKTGPPQEQECLQYNAPGETDAKYSVRIHIDAYFNPKL